MLQYSFITKKEFISTSVQIYSLISWQTKKCCFSGFITPIFEKVIKKIINMPEKWIFFISQQCCSMLQWSFITKNDLVCTCLNLDLLNAHQMYDLSKTWKKLVIAHDKKWSRRLPLCMESGSSHHPSNAFECYNGVLSLRKS